MRHFLSRWPSVSSFLLQGPELHSCVVTLKSGLENYWKLSSRGTGEKTQNLLSMGSPASIPSGLSGLLRFLRKAVQTRPGGRVRALGLPRRRLGTLVFPT